MSFGYCGVINYSFSTFLIFFNLKGTFMFQYQAFGRRTQCHSTFETYLVSRDILARTQGDMAHVLHEKSTLAPSNVYILKLIHNLLTCWLFTQVYSTFCFWKLDYSLTLLVCMYPKLILRG